MNRAETETEKLMEAIAPVLAKFVKDQVDPLRIKIEALERRLKEQDERLADVEDNVLEE